MNYSVEDYLCDMTNNPKVYLLCSPVGFGKRKLFMYISHLYAERNIGHSLVHTLDMTENCWKKEMTLYDFDMSGLFIDEKSVCSVEDIRNNIERDSPRIVMIDYLGLLVEEDAIQKLKDLSKEYSIPIIVSVNLARSCGDGDPMYRRPQLMDLMRINYYRNKTINEWRVDIDDTRCMEIIFLHRNHDCERNIGTAFYYNIGDMAELLIWRYGISSGIQSIFFNFGWIFQEEGVE